jgi:LCP family protein required for cell wall assembly
VVALVVTCTLTAGGIGGAYWLAAEKLGNARRVEVDLEDVERGKPANFLIIGSDTRSFVTDDRDAEHFGTEEDLGGQRSDTIMVAHVDPDAESGLLVSFPRDLWVEIPGVGGAKINAAFNGGATRVVETLKQNFDIPIHHYVEVNFDGFRNVVDAIGSVPIYFPTPARDRQTGLLVESAGCHRLDGQRALQYVRSREYQHQDARGRWQTDGTADLGRIRRQQYFIRSLADEAVRSGFRNPIKINNILNKVVESLALDADLGLGQLRALANTFREVDPAVVEMVTVPTEPVRIQGQSALRLLAGEAEPLFERLRSFGAAPEPAPSLAPGDVRVSVRNGSGVQGQARAALDDLVAAGFVAVEPPGNADHADYERTEVRHTEATRDHARTVAAALTGDPARLVEVESVPDGTDVVVVLGRDFGGVRTSVPAAPGTGTSAAPAPPTTSGPSPNPGGDEPLPPSGC